MDEQTTTLVASALLEAEWNNHGAGTRTCQGCHHSWAFRGAGHRPDCRVDAALKALGYPDEESRKRGRILLWEEDHGMSPWSWRVVLACLSAVEGPIALYLFLRRRKS